MRILATIVLLILVSSCGGGGGGGGSQVPTLSGRIFAASNSAIDGDVADSNVPQSQVFLNNNFNAPQPVRTPATLGGYVNSQTDPVDFFKIDLDAGQTLILYVSDPSKNLQLSLYDQAQGQTAIDVGSIGASQCVVAPQAGSYIGGVRAIPGNSNQAVDSNYNLIIGLASCNGILSASADFVPDEIIVRFKAAASGQPNLLPMADLQRYGLTIAGRQSASGALRMRIPQAQQTLQALGVASSYAEASMGSHLRSKLETLEVVNMMRQRADVEYAEPNYIYKALAVPDDTFYPRQWHYPLINLPQAWDVLATTPLSTAVVAVLDTGVILNHPDLQNVWLRDPANSNAIVGYDFVDQDSNPSDPGDSTPGGSTFHGTHVAGTVAAETNNATGVAGVAGPAGVKIMPVRVLGPSGGTSTELCEALRFAARLQNSSNTLPPQPADVINMSLGGSSSSTTLQNCIDAALGAGVIIVAAAGNEGSDAPVYPAAYDPVISVSAVDIQKNLAPYSSFGPTIDVAAPGGNLATDIDGDGFPDGVLSTVADDTTFPIRPAYAYYAGTSMATPHVAGVAALMKAINPSMTLGDFDTLLSRGTITDDLGSQDQYGYGLINAYKAVKAAPTPSGTPSLTPFLAVNPHGLNFGVLQTVLSLTVTNGGQGTLTVNPPDVTPLSASSWLIVQGSGLGTYTVSVDRTSLAIGTYTANIQFTAVEDPNPVNVSVTVQKVDNSVDPTANAGFHYAVLVNADDLSTQDTVTASFANGVYSYQFYSTPPGTYKIYAGTDSDNDSMICDAGEACGAYATTDQPLTITVESTPLSGLDFSSGFSTNLGIAAASVVSRKPLTITKALHKDVANVR